MRSTAFVLFFCFPFVLQAQSSAAPFDEVITVSSRIGEPRREVGTAVTVITRDDIVSLGHVAIIDLLRTQAAIGVSNAGGLGKVSALRIRGEEGYRTLVRIDGIDISDPSSTQVQTSVEHLVATRDIDRIEVLRGAQGFTYGADSGGVVNILSGRGSGSIGADVGYEIGVDGFARIDAGFSGAGESVDYLFYVGDVETDGFNAHDSDDRLADDDGYANTTWHTKIGWQPGDDARLELVVRDVNARTEYDRCGFPTTHDCVGVSDQTAVRLSSGWGSAAIRHEVSFSGAATDRADFADSLPAFATDGELRRIEYVGNVDFSALAGLVYGIDVEREDVVPGGGQSLRHEQDAAYIEYRRSVADALHLSFGVRRDEADGFGSHNSVRAALAYVTETPAGASVKYRASFGTGFRAPSLSELAYNAGPFAAPPAADTSLREETSRGLDLGVELVTPAGAYYELGVFDQQIDDEIFFDLVAFSGYLQSPGQSESRGLELAFEIPLAPRWVFDGNALFNDTETVDGLVRIRRPRRMANVGVRYRDIDGRFGLRANLRRSDGAVDEIFGSGRLPLADYEVADVSGFYRLDGGLEIFARVENLFDESYQELIGFNTADRTVFAGLRLRLD